MHDQARDEKLEKRFDVRIREVEERVNTHFDQVKTEVRDRIAGIKEDIAELKTEVRGQMAGSRKILPS